MGQVLSLRSSALRFDMFETQYFYSQLSINNMWDRHQCNSTWVWFTCILTSKNESVRVLASSSISAGETLYSSFDGRGSVDLCNTYTNSSANQIHGNWRMGLVIERLIKWTKPEVRSWWLKMINQMNMIWNQHAIRIVWSYEELLRWPFSQHLKANVAVWLA
jgi:hypothetical protein